jgi:hypothetical protein
MRPPFAELVIIQQVRNSNRLRRIGLDGEPGVSCGVLVLAGQRRVVVGTIPHPVNIAVEMHHLLRRYQGAVEPKKEFYSLIGKKCNRRLVV